MGVVLAGGAGRRLGGDKASRLLAGRPLISYPLAALCAVVADVTIVAKPDTPLPALETGIRVIREPPVPQHPVVGLVAALRAAQGRAVLVCAADLPFVTPAALAALRDAPVAGGAAVLAGESGRAQPLLGRYEPAALAALAGAAEDARRPLREVVVELDPVLIELSDVLFNVNAPADLAEAERRLISRT